ncbi:MAG: hypothetical protein H6622_06590 [Halobacteriovoraceae bacterium]|nr:hypothetical protein [Halobacteriovoraceae bacterium]
MILLISFLFFLSPLSIFSIEKVGICNNLLENQTPESISEKQILLSISSDLTYKPLLDAAKKRLESRVENFEIERDLYRQNIDLPEDISFRSNIASKDGGEGALNDGVFMVNSDKLGQYAIKVSLGIHWTNSHIGKVDRSSDIKRFKEFISIQRTLGELGMAPKVIGFYEKEELRALINVANNTVDKGKAIIKGKIKGAGPQVEPEVFKIPPPEEQVKGDYRVGIAMEYIPKAKNFPKSTKSIETIAQWSKQELMEAYKRMRQIDYTLYKLNIDPQDMQFFLADDGRIMLGDLDAFKMLKNGEKRSFIADYKNPIKDLIAIWEEANNEKVELSILLD